jgi:hypothetical protein
MGIAGPRFADQTASRIAAPHGAGNRGMPEQRLFLGVENSATGARGARPARRAGAARALAIAQSMSSDTRKLYYVSHRLILQGIQEVRTEEGAQQN